MKKLSVNVSTPYSQTIDAAFKMLHLCKVTYNVVNGVIFVIGRDGLVYQTLAATTDYSPEVSQPTQPTHPAPAEPVKPIPTRTRQTTLPLPDVAQITHSDVTQESQRKKRNRTAFDGREDIPADLRIRFKRTLKNRGTRVSLFEPYLRNLGVGEVAQFPIELCPEGCTPEQMRTSMSSWAHDVWGPRSHRTCKTDTHVEILRTK